MTAYARILGSGPQTAAICDPCDWRREFPRHLPALDAVRTHNQSRHAYPEQTLGIHLEEPS